MSNFTIQDNKDSIKQCITIIILIIQLDLVWNWKQSRKKILYIYLIIKCYQCKKNYLLKTWSGDFFYSLQHVIHDNGKNYVVVSNI